MCSQGYGNQRFVFQGVHETICYGPSDKPWGDSEPRINQIVFIGRKLDRKALMEGFRWVAGGVDGRHGARLAVDSGVHDAIIDDDEALLCVIGQALLFVVCQAGNGAV